MEANSLVIGPIITPFDYEKNPYIVCNSTEFIVILDEDSRNHLSCRSSFSDFSKRRFLKIQEDNGDRECRSLRLARLKSNLDGLSDALLGTWLGKSRKTVASSEIVLAQVVDARDTKSFELGDFCFDDFASTFDQSAAKTAFVVVFSDGAIDVSSEHGKDTRQPPNVNVVSATATFSADKIHVAMATGNQVELVCYDFSLFRTLGTFNPLFEEEERIVDVRFLREHDSSNLMTHVKLTNQTSRLQYWICENGSWNVSSQLETENVFCWAVPRNCWNMARDGQAMRCDKIVIGQTGRVVSYDLEFNEISQLNLNSNRDEDSGDDEFAVALTWLPNGLQVLVLTNLGRMLLLNVKSEFIDFSSVDKMTSFLKTIALQNVDVYSLFYAIPVSTLEEVLEKLDSNAMGDNDSTTPWDKVIQNQIWTLQISISRFLNSSGVSARHPFDFYIKKAMSQAMDLMSASIWTFSLLPDDKVVDLATASMFYQKLSLLKSAQISRLYPILRWLCDVMVSLLAWDPFATRSLHSDESYLIFMLSLLACVSRWNEHKWFLTVDKTTNVIEILFDVHKTLLANNKQQIHGNGETMSADRASLQLLVVVRSPEELFPEHLVINDEEEDCVCIEDFLTDDAKMDNKNEYMPFP